MDAETNVLEASPAIRNDVDADRAIRELKELRQEKERLDAIGKIEIEAIKVRMAEENERYSKREEYILSVLGNYMNSVNVKETQTQYSYKLLNGSIIKKKASQKMIADENKLIEALKDTDYIKVSKSLKWGEYKKNLTIVDGNIIDTSTGEVVDGVTLEDVPERIEVK